MLKNITFGGYAFSHLQIKGIECLARGLSQSETGRQVGVTRNTIQNWLKKPEFKAAVESKRKEEIEMKMLDADSSTSIARQDYRSLALQAVNIYKRSLSSDPDDRPDSSQLKAAKDIIDHAFGKAPFSIDHTVTGSLNTQNQEIVVQFNFWKSPNTLIPDNENEYIDPPSFEMSEGKKKIIYNLPHYAKPFLYPNRRKSFKGGRGSAKSHTAAQISIALMCGHLEPFGYPKHKYTIASVREHSVTLDRSVKKAVELYIKKLGLQDEFKIMKEKIVHKNGSSLEFIGIAVNTEGVLSMEDYFVFWVEQAEFLTHEMMRLIGPTMRKEIVTDDGIKISSELWFVWNPTTRATWIWGQFELKKNLKDIHIEANFMDNPWWNDTQEEERLDYLEKNPTMYEHTYLGAPNDGDGDQQILPYVLLQKCVKGYELYKDHPSLSNSSIVEVGFDVSEGGGEDQCCVVIRKGPFVEDYRMWYPEPGDLDKIAEDADKHVKKMLHEKKGNIWTMYFDGNHVMEAPLYRACKNKYLNKGINFGGEVGGKKKKFDNKNLNGDIFERRNIQMAMALRIRANKTAALLNGRNVRLQECLFINPDLDNLESFLSMCTKPIKRPGPTGGKLQLDKRGGEGEHSKSPDQFDALSLAFAGDSENGIRDF